eukprot:807181-Ditylum_brightwellii.AAC.1
MTSTTPVVKEQGGGQDSGKKAELAKKKEDIKKKGWIKCNGEVIFYLPQNLKWHMSLQACGMGRSTIRRLRHLEKHIQEHSDITFVANLVSDLMQITEALANGTTSSDAGRLDSQATVMSG